MQIETIYTISQLNAEVRELLEGTFPPIWVEGEISNLSRPASGHIYFTLKDEFAQIRCAMFRRSNSVLKFQPEDGMQVLVQGQVSLYTQRGDYQLIVHQMEPSGDGALRRAFEQLKNKLQAEGLFADETKKPLPSLPKSIGVVTSSTGAAIQDILKVLHRRFPTIEVIIYPTQVQGTEAKDQIVHAIEIANKRNECDVLIVGRGGGSLEDLWPFNEEIVARAIHASKIPVISAVGHEIDFTIADFVADIRAATPSAAAELVSPNREEWRAEIRSKETSLCRTMQTLLKHTALQFTHLRKQLAHFHPARRLQDYAQHIDELEQRLIREQKHLLVLKGEHIKNLMHALNTVSPLATLDRGYAIVRKEKTILKNTNQVNIGNTINAQFAKGQLTCTVDKKLP